MKNASAAATATKNELVYVHPDDITVEKGFNVRKENNYGDLEALAHSIVSVGVLDPLHTFKKDKKHIVTEGHRRLKAINLAHKLHKDGKEGFEDISRAQNIPVMLTSGDLEDRLLIMATTGEGRVALKDGEKMELYGKLVDIYEKKGISRKIAVDKLIKITGASQASIYNILKLTELPKEIKKHIADGEISGTTALQISREVGFNEKKSVAVVEKTINNAKKKAKKEGKSDDTPVRATSADIKGIDLKTPIDRIYDLLDYISVEGLDKSDKAIFFRKVITAVEKKESAMSISKLFKN